MDSLVLIDNYDSFSYNLFDQVNRLLPIHFKNNKKICLKIFRNDEISPQEIIDLNPLGIIISPGPGSPDDSGVSIEMLDLVSKTDIPLLGVCLGHQIIIQWSGGEIIRANEPVHGRLSLLYHNEIGILKGVRSPVKVARYHSLCSSSRLPNSIKLIGWSEPKTVNDTCFIEDNVNNITKLFKLDYSIVMAIKHRELPWFGLQFHPESFMTVEGDKMISNYLNCVKKYYYEKTANISRLHSA